MFVEVIDQVRRMMLIHCMGCSTEVSLSPAILAFVMLNIEQKNGSNVYADLIKHGQSWFHMCIYKLQFALARAAEIKGAIDQLMYLGQSTLKSETFGGAHRYIRWSSEEEGRIKPDLEAFIRSCLRAKHGGMKHYEPYLAH